MFEKYAGSKQLVLFEGNHNSKRPIYFNDTAVEFLVKNMQLETLLTVENFMDDEQRAEWDLKFKQRKENS